MERERSCCFTGHRPEKLPWGNREEDPQCVILKARIASELEQAYEKGFRNFISGMARGTDLYFCEAALSLRECHPDITVEAAIPFMGQADRWLPQDRNRYRALIERCNYETVIQHCYTPGCLQRRNRYMVERSSLIIAAYHGKGGGTLYTLTYAMQRNVDVVILDL
ncbi:MAG: hypothetical protein K0S60_668 [Evtepia sp.]|nr:hypothetical protein [Evtepia sp.]